MTEQLQLPHHRTVCKYGVASDAYPIVAAAPLPKIGRNQVLVKVQAIGLNPVDAKFVIGDKLPNSWTRLHSWFRNYYLSDKIPGFDFSGIVVQGCTGSEDSFHPGDAVFGTVPPFVGTLTDYLVAPVDQLYYKPRSLSWEEAAAFPLVGLTCYQVLQPLSVEHKSVLILGASGGTGHVALQVARALQAKHVVAVCSDRNVDFCRDCGASHVISYQTPDIRSALQRSPAAPFAVVLDCVSSADPRDSAAIHYPTLLQDASYRDNPPLLTADYAYRRLGGPSLDWVRAGLQRVTGLQNSLWTNEHERLFWIRFPQSSTQLQQLHDWAEAGLVRPKISQIFDFSSAGVREGMDALTSRRVQGKVAVRVNRKAIGLLGKEQVST